MAIGLFLMQWSPDECLSRFEDIAVKTFKVEEKSGRASLTERIRRLLGAYVRDYQYDSSIIDKAFRSVLGVSRKMFNPLQSDVRIAVTTTTVQGNIPCVLSNYNGGPRPEDNSKFFFSYIKFIIHYPSLSSCSR